VIGRFGLMDTGASKLRLDFGVSLPTGSTSETGTILAPTGATPTLRLPYAMQLGSGTVDLLPALVYSAGEGAFNWGAQVSGVFRMGSNNGYSLGDEAAASIWATYKTGPGVLLSGRVEAKTVDTIDGIDPLIAGPNQAADPLNYGGESVSIIAGATFTGQQGALKGHKFTIEAGLPIMQNLNGPQLETDWTLMIGWQKGF
jgi:hypothetical protein